MEQEQLLLTSGKNWNKKIPRKVKQDMQTKRCKYAYSLKWRMIQKHYQTKLLQHKSQQNQTTLTFPSAVTANSVCSPPMSCTGRRLASDSQPMGSLTFAPSTPPSWPLWLWPQTQIWPLPPQDKVQSSGFLYTDSRICTAQWEKLCFF